MIKVIINGKSPWVQKESEFNKGNLGLQTSERNIKLKGLLIIFYPFVLLWFKFNFDYVNVEVR